MDQVHSQFSQLSLEEFVSEGEEIKDASTGDDVFELESSNSGSTQVHPVSLHKSAHVKVPGERAVSTLY